MSECMFSGAIYIYALKVLPNPLFNNDLYLYKNFSPTSNSSNKKNWDCIEKFEKEKKSSRNLSYTYELIL